MSLFKRECIIDLIVVRRPNKRITCNFIKVISHYIMLSGISESLLNTVSRMQWSISEREDRTIIRFSHIVPDPLLTVIQCMARTPVTARTIDR